MEHDLIKSHLLSLERTLLQPDVRKNTEELSSPAR
ncbi:UNVERIFIED_CONTAM: hypothetical protein ABID98_001506 [Brevibacillus sp. OAP136]